MSAAVCDISVNDEGGGSYPARVDLISVQRYGLAQLRERVQTAGGVLEIAAVVGEVCRASMQLPTETTAYAAC